MKQLIQRLWEFLTSSFEIQELQGRIQQMDNDLFIYDLDWYERHIEEGTFSSTGLDSLQTIREEKKLRQAELIEELYKLRINSLRKRMMVFVLLLLLILGVYYLIQLI